MSARRACWLLIPLLTGQNLVTAQELAPFVRLGQFSTAIKLENVDDIIRDLEQIPWRLPEGMGHPVADETGRRVEDDLSEFALTEPVLRRITALRDELAASTAPGATISPIALRPLLPLLQSEYCRLAVISTYWDQRRGREYHHEMIEALLDRLAEQDRPAATQELQSIEARKSGLRAQVGPALQLCAGYTDQAQPLVMASSSTLLSSDPLAVEYNALRIKLVAQLHAVDQAASKPVQRSTPCPAPAPAPATTTPGRHAPKVRSMPDLRDYYPREAIAFGIDGPARIRIQYDTAGCVVAATLLESTGSEVLDAAALRIAFDTRLVPGEEDGKPFEGAVVLPIVFHVSDLKGTAPFGLPPQP